jgi:hypothetical protein
VEFVDEGRIPDKFPYKIWIHNYLMVRKGYSQNIEDMEIDEYDFTIELMMELNNKKKDQPFAGGL